MCQVTFLIDLFYTEKKHTQTRADKKVKRVCRPTVCVPGMNKLGYTVLCERVHGACCIIFTHTHIAHISSHSPSPLSPTNRRTCASVCVLFAAQHDLCAGAAGNSLNSTYIIHFARFVFFLLCLFVWCVCALRRPECEFAFIYFSICT